MLWDPPPQKRLWKPVNNLKGPLRGLERRPCKRPCKRLAKSLYKACDRPFKGFQKAFKRLCNGFEKACQRAFKGNGRRTHFKVVWGNSRRPGGELEGPGVLTKGGSFCSGGSRQVFLFLSLAFLWTPEATSNHVKMSSKPTWPLGLPRRPQGLWSLEVFARSYLSFVLTA